MEHSAHWVIEGCRRIESAADCVLEPFPEPRHEACHPSGGIPFRVGVEVDAEPCCLQYMREAGPSPMLDCGERWRDRVVRRYEDDDALNRMDFQAAGAAGEAARIEIELQRREAVPFVGRGQADLAGRRGEARHLLDGGELILVQGRHGCSQPARPLREALEDAAVAAGSPSSGVAGSTFEELDLPDGGLNLSPNRSRHALADLAESGSL